MAAIEPDVPPIEIVLLGRARRATSSLCRCAGITIVTCTSLGMRSRFAIWAELELSRSLFSEDRNGP